MRREHPVGILAQDNRAAIITLFARKFSRVPTRVIITIRTTLSQRWQHKVSQLRQALMRQIARAFHLRANTTVAVSRDAAKDLVSFLGLPNSHVRVIYNPVIYEDIFDKSKEKPESSWFLCDSRPIIMGVGRLTKEKDFATLIRAFAIVRRERNVRLVILGEGEERKNLKGLAKELGVYNDIKMPGVIANPFPYIARAAVFVLSSIWEGLPTVLIEALALGVPIVSTDCPSGPAEILEYGKWGRLVPVGDENAMAATICEVLDKPRRSIPKEAWERFSVERIVNEYLSLLDL